MQAFVPIKCMQLYVTNAEVRVQENRQAALAAFGELDAACLKPVFGKLHGRISCDELRLPGPLRSVLFRPAIRLRRKNALLSE